MMKKISAFLSVVLLSQSVSVSFADVTSSAANETFFIKVTRTSEGKVSSDPRVKFEICENVDSRKCDPIGSRDYSLSELRVVREKLLQDSKDEASSGASEVFGSIAGVLGGIGLGFVSGGLVTAAVVPAADGLSVIGVVILGALGGAIVVGTLGGILIYKWIRHHKEAQAEKLKNQAGLLDESVIDDEPVQVSIEISEFAKDLGDVLNMIPAAHSTPDSAMTNAESPMAAPVLP
jgi:hypothetical protein